MMIPKYTPIVEWGTYSDDVHLRDEISRYQRLLDDCPGFRPFLLNYMKKKRIPSTSELIMKMLYAACVVGGPEAMNDKYLQEIMKRNGLYQEDIDDFVKKASKYTEKTIRVKFAPGDKCFVFTNEYKLNSKNRIYHTHNQVVYPATVVEVVIDATDVTYNLYVDTGIKTRGEPPFDTVLDWKAGVKNYECFQTREDAEEGLKRLKEFKEAVISAAEKPINPEKFAYAKELIDEFCQSEYQSPAEFDDLEKIAIGYTTITDDEIPIQVYVDLVHYRIDRYLDDDYRLKSEEYSDLEDFIQYALDGLNFDELIYVSDEELNSFKKWAEQKHPAE